MIKQKLELQEKVDNFSTAVEQEKKNQEVMKDQWKKKEGELKKKCAEIETKLVSMFWKQIQRCISIMSKVIRGMICRAIMHNFIINGEIPIFPFLLTFYITASE